MSFNFKNIGDHPTSTLWGVLFLAALLGLVFAGRTTLDEIRPFALLVVPFLLYGSNGTPPASAPTIDSTAAPVAT